MTQYLYTVPHVVGIFLVAHVDKKLNSTQPVLWNLQHKQKEENVKFNWHHYHVVDS